MREFLDFIRRLFWLCLSIYLFYLSYQMFQYVPGFASIKNLVVSTVKDDIDSFVGGVEEVTGIEINEQQVPPRTKYPDYDWEDYKLAPQPFYHAPDYYQVIGRSGDAHCINPNEERDYYRSQFDSVVNSFVHEKLPQDSINATDEQIDAAMNWRDTELQNLLQPLIDCLNNDK